MPGPLDGEKKVVTTFDGSQTIKFSGTNIVFHSIYGAVQESEYIYIRSGLQPLMQAFNEPDVLEVGFGTGLNSFLCYMEAFKQRKKINYHTLDPFPLEAELYKLLKYPEFLKQPFLAKQFLRFHSSPHGEMQNIVAHFSFIKYGETLDDFVFPQPYHCVFFDPFDPVTNPEPWAISNLQKCFDNLHPGGMLVTYCCKGQFLRDLRVVGFQVEKLPGPPGKKEITRASKPF